MIPDLVLNKIYWYIWRLNINECFNSEFRYRTFKYNCLHCCIETRGHSHYFLNYGPNHHAVKSLCDECGHHRTRFCKYITIMNA